MTYFALFPASLKCRGLKVTIVFNYEAFRFEAWLATGAADFDSFEYRERSNFANLWSASDE